jgi:hypothetical protein
MIPTPPTRGLLRTGCRRGVGFSFLPPLGVVFRDSATLGAFAAGALSLLPPQGGVPPAGRGGGSSRGRDNALTPSVCLPPVGSHRREGSRPDAGSFARGNGLEPLVPRRGRQGNRPAQASRNPARPDTRWGESWRRRGGGLQSRSPAGLVAPSASLRSAPPPLQPQSTVSLSRSAASVSPPPSRWGRWPAGQRGPPDASPGAAPSADSPHRSRHRHRANPRLPHFVVETKNRPHSHPCRQRPDRMKHRPCPAFGSPASRDRGSSQEGRKRTEQRQASQPSAI